ncbi:MAG: Kef-type K+ transport system membrane component KefB, partial [Gammaproteobacteria bacterium]
GNCRQHPNHSGHSSDDGKTVENASFAAAPRSQAGEFGFVFAAVGLSAAVTEQFGHQSIIALIALSLLVRTFGLGPSGGWYCPALTDKMWARMRKFHRRHYPAGRVMLSGV